MGHSFRDSDDRDLACSGDIITHYSDYDVLYTDGSVSLVSGRTGCGFFAARHNFRYDLALQNM